MTATARLISSLSILDADDLLVEEALIPEWPDPETGEPGVMRLQQMDAERSALFTAAINLSGEDGMFIILVFCAVDTDNHLIFSMDDVPKLRKKNFRVLSRLQDICLRINKMRGEDETARKNS